MEHEHASALVPRYVDQELALAETLKFEQHLFDRIPLRGAHRHDDTTTIG